jgi:hypothetical protein
MEISYGGLPMTKFYAPIALLVMLAIVSWAPTVRSEILTPEETLRRYLTALQDHQFDKAYDLV